jgi:hypothetical protein
MTLEWWIFTKIEYLMVNSWKECSKTSLQMTTMKHIKVTEEAEEVSNLVSNLSTLDKNMREHCK